MKRSPRGVAAVLVAGAAIGMLAACSSSSNESSAGSAAGGPVTITVGEKPPADQAELLKAFDAKVAQFEKANPDIKLKTVETTWAPDTYQAMLAGGTMPTTLRVPLTEIQSLAARQQIMDITDLMHSDPVVSRINPVTLKGVTRDDKIYGVPVGSYTVGLIYNRALYTKAGLDPDKPPTTWDEVRANAKAIAAATGKAGWVVPTTKNFGGWMLTAMSYSMGGQIEDADGTKSHVDSEPVKQALDFVRSVRWDDNTFGANFLLTADDVQRLVAAGSAGQAILAGDRYNSLVVNWKMKPQDIGIGPLPQDSDGIGTLAGGNISVVRPDAKPAEAAAAVKWIRFMYLDSQIDQQAAIADAKARKAQGFPVGYPGVPLFDAATTEKYLEYVKPYVDVPRQHFTTYLGSINTLPLVPEPKNQAQQIYSLLDSTVQAALTKKDADVGKLLSDANTQAQNLIAAR
ncbi:ABC transporter substrate-binding protein [Kribbella sp. NPDC004138]